MRGMLTKSFTFIAAMAAMGFQTSWARDGLKITLPRHSELTPVQRLNREGVIAIRNRQFNKAGELFYRAYLYDPADPFTLNNLGYISELQGQLDRARKFYDLALKQSSNAPIDTSSARDLEGKPMSAALEDLEDLPMRVNRMNMNAMHLLAENRGFEATAQLKTTLSLDLHNPFTLNNLGVASEAIGDYDGALKYYRQAADRNSSESAAVTLDEGWRGQPISRMAAESAKRLEKRLQNMNPTEARSVAFTVRGVAAVNQNDWAAARQDFLKAYSLNPRSAFSLNNRGYVAERDGDLESAQFFYANARRAEDSGARVGLATEHFAEGKDLHTVATDSNQKVDLALDQYSQQRRCETGPIELTPRGGTEPTEKELTPNVRQTESPSVPH
jgi:Flp pilus assembly protein TadD